ncbi:SDR family oxidoreductase [Chamaesiphon minutus]|uniref:Short chain dehydrogenase n=1 Tax=Chamaesiphon minutus (strain ATCC 27169 / PCC 6605) TaxID=1173020 RepID=K9UQ83_CHAP6|nr:SDR family oxidoreductase [Chamaesiphon minutus]AFY96965.1 short chain dehydrogenase [Chamaesiphon minutus PCC 6605]
MNANETRTAVVAGATGIIGRAIVAQLAELGGWRIIAVSKSGRKVPGADEAIGVDLLDKLHVQRMFSSVSTASQLFFAAYLPQPSWIAEVHPNLAMLVNTVEGLESVGAPLQHITLITGAKYYGVHLGISAAPALETEPRHLGANFYYEQEDYLRSRSESSTWQWTNLVASHLTGFAAGNAMNLALAIAVYASIVREVGLRLDFPGSPAAFSAMTQIVDAEQVAAAAVWSAETPQAAGEVFNISNGDPTRWSYLWTVFATYFDVPLGGTRPIPLADFMAEYEPLWRSMAKKYHLINSELSELVNWRFLEFMFAIDYDIVLALGKIRRAGFVKHPDTIDAFKLRFEQYRQERLIPNFDKA